MAAGERSIQYDLLKILACFLVIVNHSVAPLFHQYYPSVTGFLALVYFFVCKIAVPIFLMVSGALLLPKEEPYRNVLSRRVLRMLVVLIGASFVMYIYPFVRHPGEEQPDIGRFFFDIATKPITPAYWYLYLSIALMVSLPMIRKLVRGFEGRDYAYFLTCCAVTAGIFPLIPKYSELTLSGYLFMPVFAASIGYFVIGHFLGNVLPQVLQNSDSAKADAAKRSSSLVAAAVFLISVGVTVWLTIGEYRESGRFTLKLDGYVPINTMLASAAIFWLAIRHLSGLRLTERSRKFVHAVSGSTFGIYLMHMLVIEHTQGLYAQVNAGMNDLVAVVLYQIFIFTSCGLATMLLRQVPGMKKWL